MLLVHHTARRRLITRSRCGWLIIGRAIACIIVSIVIIINTVIVTVIIVAAAAVASATVYSSSPVAVAGIVCGTIIVTSISYVVAHMIVFLQFGQLIFQKFYKCTCPFCQKRNNHIFNIF